MVSLSVFYFSSNLPLCGCMRDQFKMQIYVPNTARLAVEGSAAWHSHSSWPLITLSGSLYGTAQHIAATVPLCPFPWPCTHVTLLQNSTSLRGISSSSSGLLHHLHLLITSSGSSTQLTRFQLSFKVVVNVFNHSASFPSPVKMNYSPQLSNYFKVHGSQNI